MRRTATGVLVAWLLGLSSQLRAEPGTVAPSPDPPGSFRLFFRDTRHVLAAPFHLDRTERRAFRNKLGWVLAVGLLLDDPVQRYMTNHRGSFLGGIADVGEDFGRLELIVPSLLGLYGVAQLTHDHELSDVAWESATSALIGGGMVVALFKMGVGRSRPNRDLGANDFQPLTGGKSFPSGHAATAFALSAVVDGHKVPRWGKNAARGLAYLTCFQRLYDGHHWASDVLAGAFIGSTVGHSVTRFNHRKGRGRLGVVPVLGDGVQGAAVQVGF